MCGKFVCGMGVGLMTGAVVGMMVAASQKDVRRAANRAVRSVNHAVNDAMDTISDAVDGFTHMMGK